MNSLSKLHPIALAVATVSATHGEAIQEWVPQSTGLPYYQDLNFLLVTYGADRFVAVGSRGGYLGTRYYFHSTNGQTWSEIGVSPSIINANRIRYLNDRFIAIGYAPPPNRGGISYSSNGIDWVDSVITNEPVGSLRGITYGNGRYVVVGTTNTYVEVPGGVVFSSTDLTNWSGTLLDANFSPADVSFGNGRFVVVGRPFASTNSVFTSTDGLLWSRTAVPNTNFSAIAFGKDRFIALTSKGFHTSTNGTEWHWASGPAYRDYAKALSYANGTYVSVGSYGGGGYSGRVFAYSTNATDWRTLILNYGLPTLNDIAYGKDSFVAVGDASGILKSGDLLSPRFESTKKGIDDTLSFEITGEYGREHVLQTSSDLEDWHDVLKYTNHLPTVPVSLPEPLTSLGSPQFYRAVAR